MAIGRQGEWTIWSDKKKEPLKNNSLSLSMVADLHRFFHIEKLWKINVFNQSSCTLQPVFTASEGRVFVDGALPLPTFYSENIEQRHDTLYKKLDLNLIAKEQWNILEEMRKGK